MGIPMALQRLLCCGHHGDFPLACGVMLASAGLGRPTAPSAHLTNAGKSPDLCSEFTFGFCTKIGSVLQEQIGTFPSIGETWGGGCRPLRPCRRLVQPLRQGEKPLVCPGRAMAIGATTPAPLLSLIVTYNNPKV